MTSWEIILVLGGVPLTILILLGLLTLAPDLHRPPRYRPGQEWPYPPVWWTVDPAALQAARALPRRRSVNRAECGGCRGDW